MRHLVLLLLLAACATRAPGGGAGAARDSAATVANTPELDVASDAAAETLLVDVRSLDGTIVADMRYATANNFTGAPLPGYGANRALLRRDAAAALARVQRRVAAQGLTLHIYDAYRPVRATLAMVAWTRRAGREDLLRDGYIASRSRHNLGLAVDLTLAERGSAGGGGHELDMGTTFDTFSAAAHTANATGRVAENRRRLVAAMEAEGFTNYEQEWWHFSYPLPDPLRFDLPIRERGVPPSR
jgi:zinc D-Ala-D-Ala dipeptidase